MKKIISLILCLAMLISIIAIPAAAKETKVSEGTIESAFAEGKDSLIVFVTGIGQSKSYLLDDKYLKEDSFENGTWRDYENYAPLIANGDRLARWNLLEPIFEPMGKDPKKIFDLKFICGALRLVTELVLSFVVGRSVIQDSTVYNLLESVFKYNVVDENFELPDGVITPRYVCPLSEYPYADEPNEDGLIESEGKNAFYNSIPCAEAAESRLGENFEDYLYCFNYSPFSNTDKNAEDLHEFIETILADNKVGADTVVLVPMSMGASVASLYLYKYPTQAENHVIRVVSVVGCWNGSDVAKDLITCNYVDDSADQFYHGLMTDLLTEAMGNPYGKLITIALRFLPKSELRGFIDQVVSSLAKILILNTPSLTVLIPDYDYPELRSYFDNEKVLEIADEYYQAESTLKDRLEKLTNEEGITFSFISGYGGPFGCHTDSNAFKFMNSAFKTNSDNIINISSTAPGTQFVPFDQKFDDAEGRELSPEGSIDISGTYYKDSTWFFYNQTHELEDNNTALKLAVDLALGNIKTVSDCDDPDGEYYYPQFNDARDLDPLYDPLEKFEEYIKDHAVTADQLDLYNRVIAMKDSTVNNFEEDNALIDEFRAMTDDLGITEKSEEKDPSKVEKAFTGIIDFIYESSYSIFGAKGYFDR